MMAAFRSDPPLLEEADVVGEVPCNMQPERYIYRNRYLYIYQGI